ACTAWCSSEPSCCGGWCARPRETRVPALSRRAPRLVPRHPAAAGSAGRRHVGGRPSRRRRRAGDPARRVPHQPELRAGPRTGLRAVSFPQRARRHGTRRRASAQRRRRPAVAPGGSNRTAAATRSTPPTTPSPSHALLATPRSARVARTLTDPFVVPSFGIAPDQGQLTHVYGE